MDRESLKKSGLLEQYVLGLTNRKESSIVERAMEEDPEVMKDYRKLRDELDEYVGKNGMAVPDDGRRGRTPHDFEELDHEMMTVMTDQVNSLLIWRYVLGAACLLLLCLSGYLFRLSETNHHATVTEKAMHAQDNNNHERVLKDLQEKNNKWNELKTIKVPAEDGAVLVHLLEAQDLLLLDLSHLSPLPEGFGYYVYLGEVVGKPSLLVAADEAAHLREVVLYDHQKVLTIYRWPLVKEGASFSSRPEVPIVSFPLAEAISLAN